VVLNAAVVPNKPISAFEVAVKLLGGREKSRRVLETALLAKEFPAEQVNEALSRCAQLGYLDDRRAALDLAQRLFAEGRSRLDVERRLEAKGLDPTVAAALPHDERAAAERLLKSKRVSGVKAARLLLSRGFAEELVARLVDVPEGGE
jgi:SOS response regulatory protein OraA/RecX